VAIGPVAHWPVVMRLCLCNAHNALCNRHLVKQGVISADLAPVTNAFIAAVRHMRVDYDVHRMRDPGVWLSKWPMAKRKAILLSQIVDGYLPGKVRSFVKWELLTSLAPPTKARLIQGAVNLNTQSWLGPQVHALQCVLAHGCRCLEIFPGIDITFACGMNSTEIASWALMLHEPDFWYERDGKTWDARVQKRHFAFRRAIYQAFDPELAKAIGEYEDVTGIVRMRSGFLSYSVSGTVKSGHNDTTLWNSILNALVSCYAFRALNCRASVIVAGDDMLAAVWGNASNDAINHEERKCGIVPESRVFRSLYDVSFTSAIWVSDGVTTAFIPKPGRVLARIWWSVHPPSGSKLSRHANAIARGLWPSCHDVPVVKAWLSVMLTDDKAYDTGKDWWRDHGSTSVDLTEGVYHHFSVRYGLTVVQLRECEDFIRSHVQRDSVVSHPVINRMITVDLEEVVDREVSCHDGLTHTSNSVSSFFNEVNFT
jgi:hypothetical protein